ncbi:MAG: mechanosensitive ion channel [Deltaproteobacteria bacterium]|nr:MAG: mechanosensitive ion channel [Deltaproteobacteria bacterium]
MSKSIRKISIFTIVLVSVICFTWGLTSNAQEEPSSVVVDASSAGEMNLKILKAKRTEIEASTALPDPVKKSTLTYLDQAITFREQVDQINKDAESFAQTIQSAPKRTKEIETERERTALPSDPIEALKDVQDMDVANLDTKIRQEEAALIETKANLTKWTNQIAKEEKAPERLMGSITRAKEGLKEVKIKLDAPPPPNEAEPVIESRRNSLLTEQAKYQAEITAFEQRLAGQSVFLSLLRAERDLAELQVGKQEGFIKAWKEEAQKRRQREAERAVAGAEVAKFEAYRLPEPIQKEFDMNIQLAEALEKVIRDEALATEDLEKKEAEVKELEQEFSLAQERVRIALRSEAIGLALREQHRSLPSFSGYRQDSARRQSKMSEIQGAHLEVERQIRALSDLNAETARIIQTAGPIPENKQGPLRDKITELLNDRRELLEKLSTGYRRYFNDLKNLEFIDHQKVRLADEFRDFLDLNLMWIRSSKFLGPSDLKHLPAAVGWILNPAHWWRFLHDIWDSFRRSPVLWGMAWLLGLALFLGRRRARIDLEKVSQRVGHVATDSFLLTLRALVETAYLAVGWPFLFGLLGWQLSSLPTPYEFTLATINGLKSVAMALALYGFFYYTCCKAGLAQSHFKWSEATRLTLQRNLWLLLRILLPIVFLMRMETTVEYGDSMGRLAFMAITIGFSVFLSRVLRFSGPIVSEMIKNHPNGLLVRSRYVWFPLAVGFPLLMALLAVLGYYYHTALTLANLAVRTYELILGLAIIYHLLLRWLVVAKRRFAYEEAKRKAEEAARDQEEDKQATEEHLESVGVTIDEEEITIDEMDEQTRKLLRTIIVFATILGLWVIWDQVLPAFRSIVDVRLWSYSAEVEGVTRTLPINVYNLLIAVVIAVITFVSARNLPGVLEISILNRLSLDSGARYAFTTVCRYVITAIGVLIVFNTIGFRWSQLQWLFAALSVGIGFGLQEIVANFISGIIILFERPVRVGDIVTVDNTTGIVSRIRIRATTITDWDRKEYIVPNKEFVTGRLLNWTLSSNINRIVITVGVAYGSDTELARELLLKAAHAHPLILDDPAPLATFEGFGDNSLTFLLRAYLPSMENRLMTINELHMAIDKLFREAGITIAFPQRDVHLDASGPVDVRVVSEESTVQTSEAPDEPEKDICVVSEEPATQMSEGPDQPEEEESS